MTLTSAIDLGIRRTDVSDTAAVAATVAAGFFDDPVTQWLLPDEHRRRQLVQPMFELYVAPYARNRGDVPDRRRQRCRGLAPAGRAAAHRPGGGVVRPGAGGARRTRRGAPRLAR